MGLREALIQLEKAGGVSITSWPKTTLNYNVTQALVELQAMNCEREKEIYEKPKHYRQRQSDQTDGASQRYHGDSHLTVAVKDEDKVSFSSSASSPVPFAPFLPEYTSQALHQAQFPESTNTVFYKRPSTDLLACPMESDWGLTMWDVAL
jgi:hypothetical protein